MYSIVAVAIVSLFFCSCWIHIQLLFDGFMSSCCCWVHVLLLLLLLLDSCPVVVVGFMSCCCCCCWIRVLLLLLDSCPVVVVVVSCTLQCLLVNIPNTHLQTNV